jgi:hypothetical protein
MREVASLEGKKYQIGSVATYAIHLGELCPTESAFDFHGPADVDVESTRLAQLIAGTGVPYMRSLASFEALLPLLEGRVSSLGGYPERYAMALRLLGRFDAARTFVRDRQNEYSTRDMSIQQSFDRFAVPFLAQDS